MLMMLMMLMMMMMMICFNMDRWDFSTTLVIQSSSHLFLLCLVRFMSDWVGLGWVV
jgi:hypothetical protein